MELNLPTQLVGVSLRIDPSFPERAVRQAAEAALGRAAELRAEHAWFRADRIRTSQLLLRDSALAGSQDTTDFAFSIRVVHSGAWGFAAGVEITPDGAVAAAEQAVALAKACAIGPDRVELAGEPVHADTTWVGAVKINPFDVPERERAGLLAEWSGRLLADPVVRHVMAKLTSVQENKFYADLAGTVTSQQRLRIHPQLLTLGMAKTTSATLRTLGPPTARGWEYLTGSGWDWEGELAQTPGHLAAKLAARPVEPGHYDLVIEPSNLWLTIHETVGHATELDRALGYEASYAGTSFATPDQLGVLRYGSALMNVSADRTTEHGLATIGYDDEGVAAQSWDLIKDGLLVGFQLDRHTAHLTGVPRSNGCAFAASGADVPIQRMPNVSLRPAVAGPSTGDLIQSVADGIYLAGSNSWSIDMQRRNFQFTAQRCHRIRHGRLAEPLSDVAYEGTTTDFWRSLAAVGGEDTYHVFGADLCGKGQPVQAAPVSHGSPAALFRQVHVLNTDGENGL